MRTDLSKTAWNCISGGYIRLLETTSQPIDVRHFGYLKGLQKSDASTLFEGSLRLLIRKTFHIVIRTISDGFDTPPEHQRDYAKAGSTLRSLLDVWGRDGLDDPETSTVRSRPLQNSHILTDSMLSFSAHLWKKDYHRLCVADLLWCLHTWDCSQNTRGIPIGTKSSPSLFPSPL